MERARGLERMISIWKKVGVFVERKTKDQKCCW